ncbi:MAG: diguanylate cyclase, partial [Sphaerochaeta sp.]|nr:diguanylate cyclase [Sphaerochaeta sp.]
DCTNAEFCRRLFQAIRHTRVELEGIQVEVVISMGVALSEEGRQMDALIETADRRLYRAKLEGKGRICTTG